MPVKLHNKYPIRDDRLTSRDDVFYVFNVRTKDKHRRYTDGIPKRDAHKVYLNLVKEYGAENIMTSSFTTHTQFHPGASCSEPSPRRAGNK